MAEVQRITFTVSTNEDFRESFVLQDASGTAIDISGDVLRWRAVGHGGSSVIDASTANGFIDLDPAILGAFTIDIPRATIGTHRPGAYEHDLVIEHAGQVIRAWSGAFNLVSGFA
jgi:hypothetical protein